ncbi:hypothetical protein GGTG_09262, partial [Gaeumannomyces tritici R3-111a-1]
MANQSNESQLIFAFQTLRSNPKLSIWAAAKIYSVAFVTFAKRKRGRPIRCNTIPKLRKLTELKKKRLLNIYL